MNVLHLEEATGTPTPHSQNITQTDKARPSRPRPSRPRPSKPDPPDPDLQTQTLRPRPWLADEMGGVSRLYGKGSHWFDPDVAEERHRSGEPADYLTDSIAKLRRFWKEVPFLVAVCKVGDLHDRLVRVQTLLDAIPGFKDYATKFVQGDLVELSLVAGMPDFSVSLKVRSAIGPALEKIQQRKGLILDGFERASATVVRKHALLTVRHLFAKVVETMRSGSGRAAQLLVKILQARSTRFPHRQAIFDLHDLQCKLCTWVMVSGAGHWFTSWHCSA